MAVTPNTVWEVRTTGTDLNGGGFDPTVAGAGVDRSQQDAPHAQATTGSATSGSTTVGLGAAVADASWIGNVVRLSGGTGSQAPIHKTIVAVPNATTLTVNSSVGLVTGTGVDFRIGGACQTVPYVCHGAAAHAQAGNVVYVRGGAGPLVYPIPAAITCNRGTDLLPFMLVGYDPADLPGTRTRLWIRRPGVRPVLRGATGGSGTMWSLGAHAQRLKGLELESNGFFSVGTSVPHVFDCVFRGFSNIATTAGNAYFCAAYGGGRGFGDGSVFFCLAVGTSGAGYQVPGSGVAYGCVAKACGTGFATQDAGQARTTAINCYADGSAVATPGTAAGIGFTTNINVNCVARRCATGYGGVAETAMDLACAAWGCTTTSAAGRGSVLRGGGSGILELGGDPAADAASLDYRMSEAARSALEGAGFPADWIGLAGQSFPDIGAYVPRASARPLNFSGGFNL